MIILMIIIALFVTLPFLGRSFYSRENFPGVALSVILGGIAWFLGRRVPLIGGPVFAILLGILCSFFFHNKGFNVGLRAMSKKGLQAAIVLFGFEMNLLNVLKIGAQSIALILCTLTSAFLIAFIVSRSLKIRFHVGTLIGVGTAVCGGSAIAATAPVIGADDGDVSTAISTIFFFNILAAFVFPPLGHILGLSDTGFGLWAGTAINDTSSVIAAGYTYSDSAGKLATIVKLTRTLMIIPITFGLAIFMAKSNSSERKFNIVKIFPWFVIGFMSASVVNTFGAFDPVVAKFLGIVGKFLMVAAMAAIGMGTDIKRLFFSGGKAIFLGLCCSLTVAVTSLITQKLLYLF